MWKLSPLSFFSFCMFAFIVPTYGTSATTEGFSSVTTVVSVLMDNIDVIGSVLMILS